MTASKWQLIGNLDINNGVCDQRLIVYIATNLEQTGNNSQRDDGIGKLLRLSPEQIKTYIKAGKIRDSESISALYLTQLFNA